MVVAPLLEVRVLMAKFTASSGVLAAKPRSIRAKCGETCGSAYGGGTPNKVELWELGPHNKQFH